MTTDSNFRLIFCSISAALVLAAPFAAPGQSPVLTDVQAVLHSTIMPEPLRTTRDDSSAAVAATLLAALSRHEQRSTHDDFSVLERYLQQQPGSPWSASVHLNLGLLYYRTGYFSRAIDAYDSAWSLAKQSSIPSGRQVANRAVAELALMYARVGRMTELETLLDQVKERKFSGPAKVSLDRAREGFAGMKRDPGVSFRCGPYALSSMARSLGKEVPASFLRENQSTPRGYSLAQLAQLSSQLGVQTRAVRRERAEEIPVPSVIHLRSGHFALVAAKVGDAYSVADPTFGNDTWMSQRAIDDEGSGYFLVLATGAAVETNELRAATAAEAAATFGKGHSGNGDPGATKKKCPCEGGMAAYSFHMMRASLVVQDAPLEIISPVGPSLRLEIAYHQREDGRSSTPNYTHFGEQWVSDWVGWIDETSTASATDLFVYLPGGGHEEHKVNPSAPTTYIRQPESGSLLYRAAAGSYELRYQDGSKHIYQRAVGTTAPRKVFLSKIRDAQGNELVINYDTDSSYPARILSVTNAVGRSLHLSYDDVTDPFLVTKAADHATFASAAKQTTLTYVSEGGISRIESITDPVGIVSSFTYDETGFMTSMTTPHGTTTFEDLAGQALWNNPKRGLQITDPLGQPERVEYRVDVNLPSPLSTPSGINAEATFDWDDRMVFHWTKNAWHYAPGDPTAAHAYKWVQKDGADFAMEVVEWEKPAFEDIIWYNYPGQSLGPANRGTAPTPSAIAQVGEDENGNPQTLLTTATYHATSGNPLTQTDPRGIQTRHTYDTAGMNITKTEVLEGASTWRTLYSATYPAGAYTNMNLPTTEKDAQGVTTTYTYNAKGQPVTASRASTVSTITQTVVTRFTYDATGTNTTVPTFVAAASSVPGFLRRVEVTNPGGTYATVATYTYDAQGRVTITTDAEGSVYTHAYDGLDRLTLTTYPDATTESLSYVQDGQMILRPTEQIDREGRRTRMRYNQLGQLAMSVDAKQQVSFFEWCRCGHLRKYHNPNGGVVWWKHDVQGRVYERVEPDGSTHSYAFYPRSGKLKEVTSPNDQGSGHSTYTFKYNAKGQLVKRDYFDTATPDLTYTYDILGRLSTMVDGLGTSQRTYAVLNQTAAAGQVSWLDGPWDDDAMRYTYTYFGRVGKVDNMQDADALATDLVANATTIRQYHQQTYDVLGRPLVTTTNLGTATRTYATVVGTGLLNKPDKTVHTLGGAAGITTAYAYYPASNATHRWRLQQLKHSFTTGLVMKAQHDYTYDVDGTIAAWRYQSPGNGTAIPALDRTWTLGHDEVDQVTDVLSTLGTGSTELEKWMYSYEKMGNRTFEMHAGQGVVSTSNARNQLTQRGGEGAVPVRGLLSAAATVSVTVQPDGEPASDPVAAKVTSIPGSSQWKFEKDVAVPAGDSTLTITADGGTPPPTVQSYAVNIPAAHSTYHYDDNGNLVEQRDGATEAVQRSYTWDAENRLRTITYADGSSSEFQYDGSSQRRRIIERNASSTITSDKYLLWRGHRVWQERDSLRRVTARLHHNGHELLNYVGTSTTPSSTDQRLVLADHLGSHREVIAAAGAVERRRDYNPYGQLSETAIATAKANTPVAYTGHYWHAPSSLSLTWYRAYDPALGRWLSEDPIGESGGVNLYGYVGNGPAFATDPLGLVDFSGAQAKAHEAMIRANAIGKRLLDEIEKRERGRRPARVTCEAGLSNPSNHFNGLLNEIKYFDDRILVMRYPTSQGSEVGSSVQALIHELAHYLDYLNGTIAKNRVDGTSSGKYKNCPKMSEEYAMDWENAYLLSIEKAVRDAYNIISLENR